MSKITRNLEVLDIVTLLSFVMGVENYKSNATQISNDELMQHIDKDTSELLEELKSCLENQNIVLNRILYILEEKNNDNK